MDSEASSSSTATACTTGGGSKKPKCSNKRREKNAPNQGSNPDKMNHVNVGSPSEFGQVNSGDDSEDSSPSRNPRSRAKSKTPKRRKASASPVMIEDIIEGFAITSFKCVADIESHAQHELDDFRICTAGFTPSIPSVPSTPIPVPSAEPSATVPNNAAATATSDLATDVMDTMENNINPNSPHVNSTTCLSRSTTPTVLGKSVASDCKTTATGKITQKTDKSKKECSKKNKKSLDPTIDSIISTGNNGNSDSKVASPWSTPIQPSAAKSGPLCTSKQPTITINPKTEIAEICVKEEYKHEQKTNKHALNNNNHKLKALDHGKDSKESLHREINCDTTTNIICNNSEHFSPKHAKPSHPPPVTHCLISADCKPRESLDTNNRLLVKNSLIVEEPLRPNGQSVSSLSVSSLTSDRSSSRDRLSDASSTGRGYLASDAGTDSLYSTNPVKNRDHCARTLHNGALHPIIPLAVNSHHGNALPRSLKSPATTTANTTKVTVTTTTAFISTNTVTTIATSTKSSVLALPSSSNSSSSSLKSTSSHSLHAPHRTHTPIHREQPRPIPGLSGTRPDDRDLTPTLRPYSRNAPWTSSGHCAAVPPLAHSSPHHISPVPVSSLSLSGIHHTTGLPHHHHHTPPLHHHTPPLHPGLQAHSMFAPPIVPPAPLTSSALSIHNPLDPLSANHELLVRSSAAQEFNQRLLAERLSLSASGLPSQFLNSFHQHHHQHQHMHHYGPYGPGASLLYPGGPPLKTPPSGLIRPPPTLPDFERERAKLDKYAKLDPPLYRPGLPGLPGPMGLPSMLPPPGHGLPNALGSSNLGAFQPKSGPSSALHPSQLLHPLQARDAGKPPLSTPGQKKSGKWCAAHVRIAWEIHIHQQKQSDGQRGPEGAKPSDLLRPPSHLLAGSSLHRPELGHPGLIGHSPHSRSPFDSPHSSLPGGLFTPAHLGFPRPSPYAGLGLSSSAFGGLGSLYNRDISAIPGLTSPHEWNRLHRTPPSFPTPPAWPPKSDAEREREKERELERERDREKDARSRDRERERERSVSRERNHHHREGSQSKDLNHKERDRDRDFREKDVDHLQKRSPSRETDRKGYADHKREGHRSIDRLERSRSRSPVRNGPESLVKRESPYLHNSPHLRDAIKVKEERKDEAMMLDDARDRRSCDPRDQRIDGLNKTDIGLPSHAHLFGRNNILPPHPHSLSTFYPPNAVMDRRLLPGSPYDRPSPHLWNPFDRSPMDSRMDMVRDIEREHEQLRRLSNPLGLPVTGPSALSLMEADKLREQQDQLLRDHAVHRDRERMMHIEREQRERILASFASPRLDMDRSKLPPSLRVSEAYHPAFGASLVNSMYHPSAASRPPSNSSYHHPSGASRPPSSPVVINHNSNSSSSKSNSPSVVGVPPPLIPSNPIHHNHTASPTPPSAKVRAPTPITNMDSAKEHKIEVNSNGLDAGSQAR